jgi:hypothetical protein
MIDGNIRRTLLEVRDGIPASGHDGLNVSVGLDQGAAGIVNKSRLESFASVPGSSRDRPERAALA